MSTIILHNESENQLHLIENLLKELKIKFHISNQTDVLELSTFEKQLVQKGLDDIEAGRLISSDEARKEAEECFK